MKTSERISELIRRIQGRSKADHEPSHAKNANATKRGDGRYHKQGAQKSNAARRRPGGAGLFSQALRNLQTRRNFEGLQRAKAKAMLAVKGEA